MFTYITYDIYFVYIFIHFFMRSVSWGMVRSLLLKYLKSDGARGSKESKCQTTSKSMGFWHENEHQNSIFLWAPDANVFVWSRPPDARSRRKKKKKKKTSETGADETSANAFDNFRTEILNIIMGTINRVFRENIMSFFLSAEISWGIWTKQIAKLQTQWKLIVHCKKKRVQLTEATFSRYASRMSENTALLCKMLVKIKTSLAKVQRHQLK